MIGKKKLWGRINQVLTPGTYKLDAVDQYHIGSLKLQKGIELVVPSMLGGAVYFYPVVCVIMGLICIIYALYLRYSMGDYDELIKQYNK